MRILKPVIAAVVFGVALTACSQNPTGSDVQAEEIKAPVLTVITRQDPETQLMALILTKAAADQGSSVRILLCDKGGDLALKTPPAALQIPLAPKIMSPTGLLANLIESGVKVDVCALYLPNREFGQEALLEKVGVATPPDIAAYYTRGETKVLSF
jgi:predicted peroxiredoxin